MSTYPTLYAGQRFTAAVATSMLEDIAAKTASTSRASTTTVTADPELQFTVVANADYVGLFYFRISGDSAADMDVKFTTPGGGSDSGSWGGFHLISTAADGGTGTTIRHALNAEITLSTPSTGTAQIIEGSFRLTIGGTGGTFSIDWAQNASTATAAVMERDSWVSLKRIA